MPFAGSAQADLTPGALDPLRPLQLGQCPVQRFVRDGARRFHALDAAEIVRFLLSLLGYKLLGQSKLKDRVWATTVTH